MSLSRRDVLKGAAALGVGIAITEAKAMESTSSAKFKMKFAPHFGMFANSAGNDFVDQLKFAADEGFSAWEDNEMGTRSVADQERIAKALSDLGITMGVFVVNLSTAWHANLTTGKPEHTDEFVKLCKSAVDVAKRVNAKWMTVVPGLFDERLEVGYQTAHVVDALRRGAEVFEPHGLVMVLEPLNHFTDHPGLFLHKIPQAYEVCRSVNSPSCKILFDIYHQQISEGNLIPNIEMAWSEIAYFQIGDNPGRNEPLSGEINYRNVFSKIHAKGYTGVLGMEHGNSSPGKDGERKVIEAYRWSEGF